MPWLTYTICSANRQRVVPMTIKEKKKQLISHAPAHLFNIFSRQATGCPNDYYRKKKQFVSYTPADLFNIYSKRATGCPIHSYERKEKKKQR